MGGSHVQALGGSLGGRLLAVGKGGAEWARWPTHVAQDVGDVSLSPAHWPAQGDLLRYCQVAAPGVAVVLILLGLVYLLFGFSIAKILVTVNAALIGGCLGAELGEHVGGIGAALPAAVVTSLLA